MNVTTEKKENTLCVFVEGRIDTTTAPQFEEELAGKTEGIESIVLDLDKTDYISSAGLRVILSLQKQMMSKGGMVVRNASDDIMDVFEVTGFTDIIKIEPKA